MESQPKDSPIPEQPDRNPPPAPESLALDKKVFLVATFREPEPLPTQGSPVTGIAEHVLAVIGMAGGGVEHRFEWVGTDGPDSIARPALVTPVRVRLALVSPWHPANERMMIGLVQLAPAQLGGGPVDDDLDHLLLELAATRERGPAVTGEDAVSR